MNFEFIPVKTRIVKPPQDSIDDIIDSLEVQDGDIVFITSKIISIHQGRTVKIGTAPKEELIKDEAERYLRYCRDNGRFHNNITLVQNTLMLGAGIDESNADGYYILWPTNLDDYCRSVRSKLMKKYGLSKLGVIATDSHTTPLRVGVIGIAIGLAGVCPVKDIRGERDLFDRDLKISRVNVIDALVGMAVLLMGESNESTPVVILRGFDGIVFSDDASMKNLKISVKKDYYRPLIEVIPPIDTLDRE